MSLAGLLCVVIPCPCGWVEFVDLLHAVFFRAGSQVLLSFKLPSFLLKFCWCLWISVTSLYNLTWWLPVLSSTSVFWNRISCPACFRACSATADFSGCFSPQRLSCSFILVWILRFPTWRVYPGGYRIPCNRGQVYIGTTKWSIHTRIKEHERHCRLKQPEKSAVAEHALKQAGHEILFQNTEVLDNTSNHYVRLHREANGNLQTPTELQQKKKKV